MYRLNPNYVIVMKQDIDNLLVVDSIQLVEEVTQLTPIVVILKKNGKLKIYVEFRKLNVATKKDPFSLPFTYEVINMVDGQCEAYSFLDVYSRYHQISIALGNIYKTSFVINWGSFIQKVMPFGVKNGPLTFLKAMTKRFQKYLDTFMKIFLDDFIVYNDMETPLQKLELC